jgi:hypothetical protein
VCISVSSAGAVGDGVFKCHRCVLSSRSEVFRTMFTAPFRESSQDVSTHARMLCSMNINT